MSRGGCGLFGTDSFSSPVQLFVLSFFCLGFNHCSTSIVSSSLHSSSPVTSSNSIPQSLPPFPRTVYRPKDFHYTVPPCLLLHALPPFAIITLPTIANLAFPLPLALRPKSFEPYFLNFLRVDLPIILFQTSLLFAWSRP